MRMIARTASGTLAALVLLLASGAQAADPEAGKAKTATCMACHGAAGVSAVPEYPNLACQNEKYLVIAMNGYRDGTRSNPVMKPMMATLDDADVANIAAYYAGLPCKS